MRMKGASTNTLNGPQSTLQVPWYSELYWEAMVGEMGTLAPRESMGNIRRSGAGPAGGELWEAIPPRFEIFNIIESLNNLEFGEETRYSVSIN